MAYPCCRVRLYLVQPLVIINIRTCYSLVRYRRAPCPSGRHTSIPVDAAMFLQESQDQRKLRETIRAYYEEILDDDVRRSLANDSDDGKSWRDVVRRIGNDGWLGIGWPTEFGGQGRPATDQFIFFDETRRAGAPFPFVTINTVGPTIMRYGSRAQKERFLPGIVRGEINFSIGYTEAEAGTDLASLRTRAVRDGSEYVINGAKLFTSGAGQSDYVWLAARTDPSAEKHKGISIICVPTDSQGFSWTPIETVATLSTAATYYDDVRVPIEYRIGEENQGWQLVTSQLNHERIALAAWGGLASKLFDEVATWAASTTGRDAKAIIEEPWVQLDLAAAFAQLETMRLLNWKIVGSIADGTITAADSSSVKVFATERTIEIYRLLLGVVGARGYLRGSSGAEATSALCGRLEAAGRQAQINTFGGGVNEIQREIVATERLGMERTRR